jgi:sterol desaturase/sphingolipid hydroxylase (fatty acid hydroxylase superfamily)
MQIRVIQYHQWHHCEDPKYYGYNFASIYSFIDLIFGMYYLPGKKWLADKTT